MRTLTFRTALVGIVFALVLTALLVSRKSYAKDYYQKTSCTAESPFRNYESIDPSCEPLELSKLSINTHCYAFSGYFILQYHYNCLNKNIDNLNKQLDFGDILNKGTNGSCPEEGLTENLLYKLRSSEIRLANQGINNFAKVIADLTRPPLRAGICPLQSVSQPGTSSLNQAGSALLPPYNVTVFQFTHDELIKFKSLYPDFAETVKDSESLVFHRVRQQLMKKNPVVLGFCATSDDTKHECLAPHSVVVKSARVVNCKGFPEEEWELVDSSGNINGWYSAKLLAESVVNYNKKLVIIDPVSHDSLLYPMINGPHLFHYFVDAGDSDSIKKLITTLDKVAPSALKYFINKLDGNEETPLSLAIHDADDAIVKILLDSNWVDINQKTSEGWTPLILAIEKYNLAVTKKNSQLQSYYNKLIKLLVDRGANLEARDSDGFTPLRVAVNYNLEEIAALLISKGANLNSYDNNYHSILGTAVKNKYYNIVNRLLEKGVNTKYSPPSGYGISVYDFAKKKPPYNELRQLMSQYDPTLAPQKKVVNHLKKAHIQDSGEEEN